MPKKILIVVSLVVAIAVISYLGYLHYLKVQIDKGELIEWAGVLYTKDQLREKFPPQYIEVPAKNNPEEVYAKFREALLKGDTETALGMMALDKRDGYREAFKDKAKLDKWIKTLPEKITKESENGNFASYDIDYKTEYKNAIEFVKNGFGFWEIDVI